MEKQVDFLDKKVEFFVSKIEEILDLKNKEFQVYFFTDLNECCSIQNTIPGAMFTPAEISMINKRIKNKNNWFSTIPTVVINDTFLFQNDFQLLGTVAHEMRHVWQFYNMENAHRLLNSITIPNTKEYFNSKIENDAYAFQMLILKTLEPSITIKEIHGYFPDVPKLSSNLSIKYKKKIKKVFEVK